MLQQTGTAKLQSFLAGKRRPNNWPPLVPVAKFRADLLSDFVERCQPWGRERVPVPRQLRWALWAFIPVAAFLGHLAGDHRHRIHRMPRTDLYGRYPRPSRRSATSLRRF